MYSIASDIRTAAKKLHPDKEGGSDEAFKALMSIRDKYEALAKRACAQEEIENRNKETIRTLTAQQAYHAQELENSKNSLGEALHQWTHWCDRAQEAESRLQCSQAQASAADWWQWRSATEEQAAKKEKERSTDLEKRLHAMGEKLKKALEGEKTSAESLVKAREEIETLVNAREDIEFWTAHHLQEFQRAKDEAILAGIARSRAARRASKKRIARLKERIAAREVTANGLRGAPDIGRSPRQMSRSPVPRRKRPRQVPQDDSTDLPEWPPRRRKARLEPRAP